MINKKEVWRNAYYKGSADFFAIDPYRTQFVRAPEDGIQACVSNMSHPLWPECHEVVLVDTNGWAAGLSPDPLSETWLQATPNFFRQSMKDLHTRWPAKKMVGLCIAVRERTPSSWLTTLRLVCLWIRLRGAFRRASHRDVPHYGGCCTHKYDNGFSIQCCSFQSNNVLLDYFMTYLGEVLLSIHEDKIPIAGTFAWGMHVSYRIFPTLTDNCFQSAMIDNAEWGSGLSAKYVPGEFSNSFCDTDTFYRFGVQHVNYTTLERTYKRSAFALCMSPPHLFCSEHI